MADTDLGTAKGKIVIDSSDAKKGLDDVNKGIDDLDGKAGKSSTGGLTALSGALLGIGVAGAAGFGIAIKTAADFEQTLSGIQAVSGATGKEMDALKKKALKLGADTAFSASEAAQAMEELSKSGVSVEDILNGAADATVALAAAGGTDLPNAAAIAANAMNQFNLSAEQLPHIADLIAGSANASAIDVNDFGLAMAQAGATANLIGLSFDDLALGITAMGNAGVKGSDAGTSLKTFLTGLQPVTEKQISLFADLGITQEGLITSSNTMGNSFFDAAGHVKSMSEIAGTLNTALAGMSDAQKTATLETLFGSDAIRAAAIIANEGADGMDNLSGSITGISAAEVAKTRMDNLKGSFEQFKGSVDTVLITVGDFFLPILKQVTDKATLLVNKFSELDPKVQSIAIGAVAGGTALAGLAGGAGLAIKAAAPVAQGIGSIVSAIGSLGGALLTFAANPVVLIIAAVVAVVAALVLLYLKVQAVRDFIDELGRTFVTIGLKIKDVFEKDVLPVLNRFYLFFTQTIVPAVEGAVNGIITAFDAVVGFFQKTLIPGVQKAWDAVMKVIDDFIAWFNKHVTPTIEAAVDLIVAVFDKIVVFMNDFLIPAWQTAWDIVTGILSGVWAIMAPIIQAALDIIIGVVTFFFGVFMAVWEPTWTIVSTILKVAWDTIVLIIETALGIIRGIIQIITGIITGDWDKFLTGLRTLWDTVWNAIATVIQITWDLIKGIVETGIQTVELIIMTVLGAIETAWDIAWTVIRVTVETVWAAIQLVIDTTINIIKAIITDTINAIQTTWELVWGAISGFVSGIWDDIKGTVETAINLVSGTITTVLDTISSTWHTTWSAIWNFVSTMWNNIKSTVDTAINTVSTIISDVIGGISETWSTIWGGISGAVTGAWDLIKTTVQSIVDFIDDKVNWLKDRVQSAIDFLPSFSGDDVPFVPGIAVGGIVTKQTLAYVGEAGPEAVIPLTNPSRAMDIMAAAGLMDMVLGHYSPINNPEYDFPVAPTPPTINIAPAASPSQWGGPAVEIQEAHFYDSLDLETLMAQTEFAVAARGF